MTVHKAHLQVQFSRSVVSDSATPWTVASQASLSIINSRSLLKLMPIESGMPSNHLILCHPFLLLPSVFPNIRVFFPSSQFFTSGSQSIGVSASASVLPMNIQDWFPLGLTGLISFQFKGLKSLLQHHRNIHTSSGISTQIYLSLHSPKPPGGSR